jgi:hypothetical protein
MNISIRQVIPNDPHDELEACREALEDHHSEFVKFFVDDGGNWYAEVNTDHGSYSNSTIFKVVDDEEINEELLNILGVGREIGSR